MAISFDGATRRIILDSTEHSAEEIWSRWVDWHASNPQWPVALRQVGGDDLGGGLFIPIYIFEVNGWRVRPMEANHNLKITGNLFVEGGGIPVVSTLGTYQVNVNYTVPVQAQAMSTTGSTAPSASEVADAVWQHASATDLLDRVTMAQAILRNKTITDPATGIMTVYDLDEATPLFTAALYQDAAGTIPYAGAGAERRETLAPGN